MKPPKQGEAGNAPARECGSDRPVLNDKCLRLMSDWTMNPTERIPPPELTRPTQLNLSRT
jgi:hypothetical protein